MVHAQILPIKHGERRQLEREVLLSRSLNRSQIIDAQLVQIKNIASSRGGGGGVKLREDLNVRVPASLQCCLRLECSVLVFTEGNIYLLVHIA